MLNTALMASSAAAEASSTPQLPAPPPLRLTEIYIHGFRSFRAPTTVPVRAAGGLICIAGPNGSGKSTLIDAVLFGLGAAAADVGARQAADLATAPQAEVRLTFRPAAAAAAAGGGNARGSGNIVAACGSSAAATATAAAAAADAPLVVSSSVSKATGQRAYALGGRRLPKARFDALVASRIGLALDAPCWRIGQHSVARVLAATPAVLHGALCEAAGTAALNRHRLKAIRKIACWRTALIGVQANVARLEDAVRRDAALLNA
ncbi:unnamed protein product, partial [Phaeothamnion confervicola]